MQRAVLETFVYTKSSQNVLQLFRMCKIQQSALPRDKMNQFSASFTVAVFGLDSPNKKLRAETEPWRPRLLRGDNVSSIVLPGDLN